MTKLRSAVACLALLAALPLFAQPKTPAKKETPTPTPTTTPAAVAEKLPTKEDVQASLQRTFGFDPSLNFEVADIHPSGIPGLAEVVVVVNKQQTVRLYINPDVQLALHGELVPFGRNPYAEVRKKLQAADGPVMGSPTPTVLLVEFSDLECPHCKAAQPIIEKLITDFPQIRYVFQQFPIASIHPWAMKAATYANCAGRTNLDAFWKYVDAIFQNQDAITPDNADSKLKELATGAGLDADKIAACAATPETEANVKKSLALGQDVGVDATPAVFLNGRLIGSLPSYKYDQLKQLVQFEIDHAGQ